jgi:hypothetical protein
MIMQKVIANERIRSLIKQAGGKFTVRNLMSNPPQQRESVELWDEKLETFAKLIIEECSSIASENPTGAHAWNAGILIEQHFKLD